MNTAWTNDHEDEEREAAEDERIADLCLKEDGVKIDDKNQTVLFGRCLSEEELIAVTNALMKKWGI